MKKGAKGRKAKLSLLIKVQMDTFITYLKNSQ